MVRDDLNLEVGVMIEDEMIVEEVDHAIEIEETIVSIMMDTIEEAVDMMIVEGLILKIYENMPVRPYRVGFLIHFYASTSPGLVNFTL